MLTIDGSMGEGGGQILRIALAWSALRSEPVRIKNIRANRPKPGLKPQHLTTLLALRDVTDAEVKGANLGSREVEFIPDSPKGGDYTFDCGTAGSITLMIQAILPALLRAESASTVTLRGGTDVKWSPPADHTKNVLLPVLKMMGARAGMEIVKRGYYPEGGGKVVLNVRPSSVHGIRLEGASVQHVEGLVHYSKLPEHVPKRMKLSALKELSGFNVRIGVEKAETAVSTGTGISLWSVGERYAIGGSALGERGIPAERLGLTAGKEIKKCIERRAGTDIHLADQLLIYTAMAGGSKISTPKITLHTMTAMRLLELLEDVHFYAVEEGGTHTISVEKD